MKTPHFYELEVADGLESIVSDEVKTLFGKQVQIVLVKKGVIQLQSDSIEESLSTLQTVSAVYLLLSFQVPRPSALLGHEHFKVIIQHILRLKQLNTFKTFSISTAGENSTIMQRIKADIASHTKLEPAEEVGDLRIRIRPGLLKNGAWDVLLRITPRPLATRPWRVKNMEGALNAPVANAMMRLLGAKTNQTVVNIGCGSGTLLIEGLSVQSDAKMFGCDVSDDILSLARQNIATAKLKAQIPLFVGDAVDLPFGNTSVDLLCADLPFGQLLSSKAQVEKLYPRWLLESARIIKTGGHFVLITHAIRLIEKVLREQESLWMVEQSLQITLNGLHPKIYLLQRK